MHAAYVKLLLLGVLELMSLPLFAYEGVGYRGLKLDGNEELKQKYLSYRTSFVVGELLTLAAFMSVSTDDSVADGFGDFVFFVFVKVRGAKIAVLSQIPKEAEILVPPPSVFRIKAVAKFGGKLTITLEQELCPLSYLSQTSIFKPSARVEVADFHEESLSASLLGSETSSKHVSYATTLQIWWGRRGCFAHKNYRGVLCMISVVLVLASVCLYVGVVYGFDGSKTDDYRIRQCNLHEPRIFLGSCSDQPTHCFNSVNEPVCSTINSTSYSCSWPSWFPCGSCPRACSVCLFSFEAPDYEKGACVTTKGLSLWQLVGLVVGAVFCAAAWFVSVWRLRPATWWFFGWLVFYIVLFGLVLGLGSSHYFHGPKAMCGNSSSSVVFCDPNAYCIYNTCVCKFGFSGDGLSCTPE